jgi:ABC-2 type transport system permease protein
MVPLVALILRGAGDHQGMATASAAGGLAFMSGQVAGSLSWITVSAEDAPELIAASPARLWTVWRAKVTAALIPLAVLLAVPIGVLVWMSPLAGAVAAIGCAASSVSTALINIWMQKPGKRQDFRRRRDAALVATIAELVVGVLWGAAAGLAAAGYVWGAIPAVLAVTIILALRRSDEAVMRRLSEIQA